jgi:hypothetical protein
MTRSVVARCRGRFTIAAAAALAGCLGTLHSSAPPRSFSTAEGAALDAAWRTAVRRPDRGVTVNLPPSSPATSESFLRDLSTWNVPLRLLRDSSMFARLAVSPESLAAWGGIYDIRVSESDSLRSRNPSDTLLVYTVRWESCRAFPCHAGWQFLVVRTNGQYASGRRIAGWRE